MKRFKQHLKEVKQEFDSEGTSRNQKAGALSKIKWKAGEMNLDYGGGKFQKSTIYLKEQGITNLVYDIQLSSAHNKEALRLAKGAITTTCLNVLNVIKEKSIRKEVIKACKRENTKDIYFSVFPGEKEEKGCGVGRETTKGNWQNFMFLEEYLPEVKAIYSSAHIKYNMIIVKV